MKSCIIIFLLNFIIYVSTMAQVESSIWYFGTEAGLDFKTDPPVILTDGKTNTREGVCTISDSFGNLLFYSDGTKVWNKNHVIMPNGLGLSGDYSSTQSSIIIPDPGNSTQYYLFTTAIDKGLLYNKIEMKLDNGNGDIISSEKNVVLLSAAKSSEKITVTRHCNGKDYWLVSHKAGDEFVVYLVDGNGVSLVHSIAIGKKLPWIGWQTVSYLKFSHDSKLLVNAIGPESASKNGLVEIFNFDNESGKIYSQYATLEGIKFPYGIEVSPDNNLLYVSCLKEGIYQYNLSAGNITGSKITIANPGNTNYGALQLGNDGKIYVSCESGYNVPYHSLHRINFPDEPGVACGYEENAVFLKGKHTLIGLPSFSNSIVYVKKPEIKVSYICENKVSESIKFYVDPSSQADSIKWDFGDGSFSHDLSAFHSYSSSDDYQVKLLLFYKCKTDTLISNIFIGDADTIYETVVICPGENYRLPDGTEISAPGLYSSVVFDINGCMEVYSTNVSVSSNTPVLAPLPPQCAENDSVLLEGIPAGGTWSGDGVAGDRFYPGDAGPGTHIIKYRIENNGCVNIATMTVIVNAANMPVDQSVVICPGESYTLPDGVDVSVPGTYQSVITVGSECPEIYNTVVSINSIAPVVTPVPPQCVDNGSVLLEGIPAGGIWTGVGVTGDRFDPKAAGPGIHTIKYSVIDNSCLDTTETVIMVNSYNIDIHMDQLYIIDPGESVTLKPVINGDFQKIMIVPDQYLTCSNCQEAVATPDSSITYHFQVYSKEGCYDEIEVRIVVRKNIGVFVPNVFTPNSDGINDRFTVYTRKGIESIMALKIFDRWGELVFENRNFVPNNELIGWDGTFKNKALAPGVFAYFVEIDIPGEGVTLFKGDVTLLR